MGQRSRDVAVLRLVERRVMAVRCGALVRL